MRDPITLIEADLNLACLRDLEWFRSAREQLERPFGWVTRVAGPYTLYMSLEYDKHSGHDVDLLRVSMSEDRVFRVPYDDPDAAFLTGFDWLVEEVYPEIVSRTYSLERLIDMTGDEDPWIRDCGRLEVQRRHKEDV